MKSCFALCVFMASHQFALAGDTSMLHRPMPLLRSKTLDGRAIDAAYYKGHVTIVSFMYIGCQPCMNEISVLNRITGEYASDARLQVLCVARQMPEQMRQFNSAQPSLLGTVRHATGGDSMHYTILPACPQEKSKMTSSGKGSNEAITLKQECDVIERTFHVSSYPTLFYVNRKGIIQKIAEGGPGEKNSERFYIDLKTCIDSMLAEG